MMLKIGLLLLLWGSDVTYAIELERVLPRFVSLKVSEANVRAGPDMAYPIVRRYMRPRVPLEIVGEVKDWRRVRDWDGKEGWVHRMMLSNERYAVVKDARGILRERDDARAAIRAYLEADVFVKLLHCREDWCLVRIHSHEGWILRHSLWGIYQQEKISSE